MGAGSAELSVEQIQNCFAVLPVAVAVASQKGEILASSKALTELLDGRDPSGRSLFELCEVDQVKPLQSILASLALPSTAKERPAPSITCAVAGRSLTAHINALDPRRPQLGLVIVFADDAEQRERDRIAFLASHDALTGLPNRAFLSSRLEQLLEYSQSGQVVVLFCDVDGFKPVNDTHGHKVGDEVLKVLSHRLGATVRARDVVGRWGGDEFVVLTEGLDDAELAILKSRLAAAAAAPIKVGAVEVHVGLSVGHHRAEAGQSADLILEDADARMYATKVSRRGTSAPS